MEPRGRPTATHTLRTAYVVSIRTAYVSQYTLNSEGEWASWLCRLSYLESWSSNDVWTHSMQRNCGSTILTLETKYFVEQHYVFFLLILVLTVAILIGLV